MPKTAPVLLAVVLPLTLAACGGASSDYAKVNAKEVVDRIAKTLVNFDVYLRRYDYKYVDATMMKQFNNTIQHDLNAAPRFHPTKIITRMAKDTSIMGYGDVNKNGKADKGEPKLFKMEMDLDNNRVIVTTGGGQATGRNMSRSGGFFAGVMVGSLMNRQTDAGIKRGHFDKRRVANAPISKKVALRGGRRGGSTARSAARSGGIRGGK